MMEIVWLPRALENLQEIKEYIRRDNPRSAEKVATKIIKTISLIKQHPHLGKPSLIDGFREIKVADLPFVIPYKVVDNQIIIVRVFHEKIDFKNDII